MSAISIEPQVEKVWGLGFKVQGLGGNLYIMETCIVREGQ